MKHRILSILLVCCIVLALLPARAAAETSDWITVDGIVGGKIDFDESTGMIVECERTVTSAIIPNVINGVAVTSIDYGAFSDCNNLTEVVIPEGVTKIDYGAFRRCENLSKVVLPESLSYLGWIDSFYYPNCGVFTGCTKLVSAGPIGSGCNIEFAWRTEIPYAAFRHCDSLEKVIIPEGITSIEEYTFLDCENLTDVLLPETLTSISDMAFTYSGIYNNEANWDNDILYADNWIIAVDRDIAGKHIIRDGTKGFVDYSFKGSLLTEITIPDSVKYMGVQPFTYCRSLENVVLSSSASYIGKNAFDSAALMSLSIPEGVTYIDDYAFASCHALVGELVIPDSVVYIGKYAFWGCSFDSIIIPRSVISIGQGALDWLNSKREIYYAGSEEEWKNITNGYSPSNNIHYQSTGPDDVPDDDLTTNCNIRYFTEWDAENQIAHFAGSFFDLTITDTAVVTEETDLSFLENIDSLIGQYVLAETKSQGPDSTDPNILLSIKPVETKLGTVTSVDDMSISIDGQEYPLSYKANAYKGSSVIYWLSGSKLEGFDVLLHDTGRLIGWDKTTQSVTIFKGIGSNTKSYTLSPLASNQTIAALDESRDEDVTYYYDYNNLVYRVNAAPESPYYVPAEEATEDDLLRYYIDQWYESYENYVKSVKKALDSYAVTGSAGRENIIAAQAEAMRKADSGSSSRYISFSAAFPDSWKDEAYKALAALLYDNACSNVDFSNIDVSNIFAGSTLVQTLMRSMANTSAEYSYGDIAVQLHVYQFGTSKFGQLTCYKKSDPSKNFTATICSTQAECAETIQAYWEELKNLENSTLFNIYTAVSKDILGKPLSSYTKDFIKKEVEKYAAELSKSGIGDLANALNTCYNYYNHVERLVGIDPSKAEDVLTNINSLEFKDTSITDKAVNKAMKKLNDARNKLNQKCADYIAGTLEEGPLEAIWHAVVGCPVNVSIFNSDGEQIGYAGDDDIWYTDAICIEENGDAKIIDSFSDDELKFVVCGTDYGIVSFSIEEYDENDNPAGRVNFYDIPLEPDQELSLTLPDTLLSNNNTIEVATNAQMIYADEYIASDQNAGVSIACSTVADDEQIGGVVSGTGVYVRGDAVTLLAVPEEGYHFIGWYDGEFLVSVSPLFEFVARTDMNLTAVFASKFQEPEGLFTLETIGATGGSVDGGGEFTYGSLATVIAIADRGYCFDGWYIDDLMVSTDEEYKFLMTSDVTIAAKFSECAVELREISTEPASPAILNIRLLAEQDCTLLVALYAEDGKITHVGLASVSGQLDEQVVPVSVSLEGDRAATAKAFLLGTRNCRPLCESSMIHIADNREAIE